MKTNLSKLYITLIGGYIMKRYISGNVNYDIPIVRIEVDIYSLLYIQAATSVGGAEYLPEITDKRGNILDVQAYKEYKYFLKDVNVRIKSMPISDFKSHSSQKSASEYYKFSLLDDNKMKIAYVECILRVSDHPDKSKKLRKQNHSEIGVEIISKNSKTTYSFTAIILYFTSYSEIVDGIADAIDIARLKLMR